LADFTSEVQDNLESEAPWILYVDGSSNKGEGGARVFLEGSRSLRIEQSLHFDFKASNNQVEYEALIARLLLAKDMGVQKVECKTGSQLIVGHISGEYQVKDPLLLKYYHRVVDIMAGFESVTIHDIKREDNSQADILSKLASSKQKGLQQNLSTPSLAIEECMTAEKEGANWISKNKGVLEDREPMMECRDFAIAKKTSRFSLVGYSLYKRGFSTPLLKCVPKAKAKYI